MIKFPSKNLSHLDLSNKGLTNFPEEVLNLKNLKTLNLSGNQIVTIPKNISDLKYLKSLDLSNNQIKNLFSKICELPNLKVLNLNNNNIKTIPTQINKLTRLEKLFVANNYLYKLPNTFGELQQLRELNLSKNNFREIPLEILNIHSIKSIWLNNLELETFPLSKIIALPKLKNLYCFGVSQSKNKIDRNFYNLSALRGNSISMAIQLAAAIDQNNQVNSSDVKASKNNIFISYSHQDAFWLKRVLIHLSVLENNGYEFDVWDDTKIDSGSKWKEEIERALDKAGIAILLISTDFLASKFIRTEELPTLIQNAEKKGTRILPVIVAHCLFRKDNLGIYQSLNDPSLPLESLSKPEAERELVKLAEAVIEQLKKTSS